MSTGSGYLFHRTREQPTPDPDSPPIEQIKFYLDRYKIKEALRIFFHDDTLKLLRDEPDFMWDIIPLICRRLRGLCQYRFRVFEGCERMLCRIAVDENCNPKEVLISLLAEIGQPSDESSNPAEDDDNVFRAMIRPLEGTLLRMNDPSPRGENYRWVLKVLMRHIDNITMPQDYNLDGKKRLSLPNDQSVKRFIEVLPLVLSFIEDFIEFKPICGIDYDLKAPMPILTKSQIDEVLDGIPDGSEGSESDDQIDGDMKNLDQLKADYVDFAFAKAAEAEIANGARLNNHHDETSKCKDIEEDDLANFYDDHSPPRGDITDASVTALMSLIQRPLTFLDLTNYCSDLRVCANRCLNLLLEQVPNLFAPIYKRILNGDMFKSRNNCDLNDQTSKDYDYSFNEESISRYCSTNNDRQSYFQNQTMTSDLSLATCSYIFRCERAQSCPYVIDQSFPQILEHESLLFCYTPYVIALLERSEILAHEKGLLLLESILGNIGHDSLDMKYLDLFERSTLFKNLFRIMVYSHMCTNRRRAYDIFTSICDSLTYDCKIKVFNKILNQSDQRPCVRAACIDQYRKHLTIVHKEVQNLHQQLSFMSNLANNDPSDNSLRKSIEEGQQQQIISPLNGTSSEKSECKPETLSNPVTLLHNLTKKASGLSTKEEHLRPQNPSPNEVEPAENGSLQDDKLQVHNCKVAQEDRIMEINNDIMRRIRLWHSRYNIIGGETLVEFLEQCIRACIPDSHCTDLVIENYELLLATLSIFRYLKLRKLVVRDESEEKFLAPDRLKKVFFDPVRSAIAMIMAELRLHHEEIVSKHKASLAVASAVANTEKASMSTSTSTLSKSKSSKKRSKSNSNGQKSNGNTVNNDKRDSSKFTPSEVQLDTSIESMSASPLNAGEDLTGAVEKYDAVIGHLRTEQGELECINWVMCRLDLVESVLVRTCDLYNC